MALRRLLQWQQRLRLRHRRLLLKPQRLPLLHKLHHRLLLLLLLLQLRHQRLLHLKQRWMSPLTSRT